MIMPNQRTHEERLNDLVRNMKYLYDHERRSHTSNEMGWHHDLCGIQLSVMCQYREVQPIDFRSAEIMAIVEGEVKSLLGYIARAKSEPQRLRFGRILDAHYAPVFVVQSSEFVRIDYEGGRGISIVATLSANHDYAGHRDAKVRVEFPAHEHAPGSGKPRYRFHTDEAMDVDRDVLSAWLERRLFHALSMLFGHR